MLREIIIPNSSKIVLPIPKNYMHRKIEIIAFPLEPSQKLNKSRRKAGSAKGTFKILKDFDASIEGFEDYLP